MFLTNTYIPFLIVAGAIVLFIVSYTLNRKVKAPKGVDIPEKCSACASESCIIKISDIEKKKEELKEYLEKCDKEGK